MFFVSYMKKVWSLSCSLRTPMALVGYMRRIWPSIANVIYNAVRHNFPNVINHAPEVLFPRKVGGVFPQPTVFQSSPEPLVIIATFGVIRYPCRTAIHRLECRKTDTRRLQAEITRQNIDVMSFGRFNCRWLFCWRRDFARRLISWEETNRCWWRRIIFSGHGKTFATWE